MMDFRAGNGNEDMKYLMQPHHHHNPWDPWGQVIALYSFHFISLKLCHLSFHFYYFFVHFAFANNFFVITEPISPSFPTTTVASPPFSPWRWVRCWDR